MIKHDFPILFNHSEFDILHYPSTADPEYWQGHDNLSVPNTK